MGKLRKSILVLGDSLCFGRPDHGILRKDTWPYLTFYYYNEQYISESYKSFLEILLN